MTKFRLSLTHKQPCYWTEVDRISLLQTPSSEGWIAGTFNPFQHLCDMWLLASPECLQIPANHVQSYQWHEVEWSYKQMQSMNIQSVSKTLNLGSERLEDEDLTPGVLCELSTWQTPVGHKAVSQHELLLWSQGCVDDTWQGRELPTLRVSWPYKGLSEILLR